MFDKQSLRSPLLDICNLFLCVVKSCKTKLNPFSTSYDEGNADSNSLVFSKDEDIYPVALARKLHNQSAETALYLQSHFANL